MPDPSSFQLPQEFLIAGAAVQTGLFDEIKNDARTLEELADKLKLDQRALWMVVEALEALNYVAYDGDKVKLTEEADNLLYNPDCDQYIGFSFMHTYHLVKAWTELPQVMKSGKPVSKKDVPDHTTHFIRAMSHNAQKSAEQIADYCLEDLPANPTVLDIGGGPLTYARAFARKGAKVTVLDLPEVVDMMQPELEPSLPVQMVGGDFTKGLPSGSYDLIYLGNICHIYGEKENRKLFLEAAEKLVPKGQLVINDMIRGTGVWPAIFGVNMLINTETGGTWTYEQYKTWLADAGLLAAFWTEKGGRQLIKATKP